MRPALLLSSVLFLACGTPVPQTGTGGGTGTTARCTTTNCAGCCDAADVCQLGQSATACGTGGNACLACGTGLTCTNAVCKTSAGTGGGAGGGGGSTGTKRLFITSATYSGNLLSAGGGASGLAGGDALCNLATQAAGVGGTWVAWLSSSTERAFDRVTGSGPWVLMGTTTVIFNNKANLATSPRAVIDRDERGQVTLNVPWTGTSNGGGTSGYTCQGWTTTSGFGTYGRSDIALTDWSNYNSLDCSGTNGLLCLEL